MFRKFLIPPDYFCHPPVFHHDQTIGHPKHFGEFVRYQDGGYTILFRFFHQRIDVCFDTDVDTTRWAIKHKQLDILSKPAAEIDFLLVTAESACIA